MTAKRKHALIVIAVLFVCAAVIGSFLLVSICSHHECQHDDDCAVCRVIAFCVRISSLALIQTASAAVAASALITATAVLSGSRKHLNAVTLVSLRTELRD